MIDPDSIPREEGEPAPEPKGTPRDGINLLLELTQKKRLNSNELSQIWNLLAFGYYTIEDMDNTLRAYEEVLAAGRQGVIMESLKLTPLERCFNFIISVKSTESPSRIWISGKLNRPQKTLV